MRRVCPQGWCSGGGGEPEPQEGVGGKTCPLRNLPDDSEIPPTPSTNGTVYLDVIKIITVSVTRACCHY